MCNFRSHRNHLAKRKRTANENCSRLPGSQLERQGGPTQSSRYVAALQSPPPPALPTVRPTLHAAGSQATLSVTTMWLLRCCSHKGKRSSGGGWCVRYRKTHSDLFKGNIQRAPLEELGAPPPLGACVFAYGAISLSAPGGLSL